MSNIKELSIQARKNLRFHVPLDADSEMWVDLNAVRGEFNLDDLLWKLGVDDDNVIDLDESQFVLFGGHVGCGKSTELRRLERELHRPERYYVIFVDVIKQLNVNELRYCDVLLAQANLLFQQLNEQGVQLDKSFLDPLSNWFTDQIKSHEQLTQFSSEVGAKASTEAGLPLLVKLSAWFTASIRNNSTRKTTIREVVTNTFTEFSEAYNALLVHAEEKIKEAGLGQKILFIVDGSDRLQGEDAHRFFITDGYQLQQIRSNFVYCTPISLLCEEGMLQQRYNMLVRLPMIKITEKHSPDSIPEAIEALRELIYLRVPNQLFASEGVVDALIMASGGHVRDLIRLVNTSLGKTKGQRVIDQAAVDYAIKQIATEYKRFIRQEDYELLVDIDLGEAAFTPASDRATRLLYNLTLLEYNAYWWQSHPLVRTIDAYMHVRAKRETREPG